MKQIHISLQAFKCAKIKAIKEKFVFLKYIYIFFFYCAQGCVEVIKNVRFQLQFDGENGPLTAE